MAEPDPKPDAESQPEPTREQFAQRVIDIVRNRFPLMKVGRAPQSFSLRVNGRICALEDLYRQSLITPADGRLLVERWALDLLRRDEGVPDQTEAFEEIRPRIMPLLRGAQSSPGDGPRFERALVADLAIVYVIDNEPTTTVTPLMLQRWGVDGDDLHQAALANLVARSEAVVAQAAADSEGKISLIQFQSRDGYDASRLLLPTLHDRLREHLGSPFGAGVPTRDLLLCFRNTEEVRQRMRQPIRDGYRHMPEQLSEQLLLVTADGIAPMIA